MPWAPSVAVKSSWRGSRSTWRCARLARREPAVHRVVRFRKGQMHFSNDETHAAGQFVNLDHLDPTPAPSLVNGQVQRPPFRHKYFRCTAHRPARRPAHGKRPPSPSRHLLVSIASIVCQLCPEVAVTGRERPSSRQTAGLCLLMALTLSPGSI